MNVNVGRTLIRRLINVPMRCTKRHCEFTFSFDTKCEDEIIENHFRNVLMIGINIPERKNMLNHSALCKLNESLKHFDENDEYSAAVLFGIGGNLCKGVDDSVSKANCEEVIKTMSKLRKPTLASVTGHTTGFGFQLALMCDLRYMEDIAIFALRHKNQMEEIFPVVLERLIAIAGLSIALDVVLTGSSRTMLQDNSVGIVNEIVKCGTAVGKCVNVALGITKNPLSYILKSRSEVFSMYETMRFNMGNNEGKFLVEKPKK